MKKTMLFAVTEDTLLHVGEVRQVAGMVVRRTLVVKTPDHKIGAAVILAGRIITALSLVRGFSLVNVWFDQGRRTVAVVAAMDEDDNLARLELYDPDINHYLSFQSFARELETENPTRAGGPRAIGDPLLVATNRTGFPSVRVAGMMYNTVLCERRQGEWKIRPNEPRGLIGSGVWSEEGDFMGLAVGQRIAPPEKFLAAARKWVHKEKKRKGENAPAESEEYPRVYGLPAETVLDFAETA